MLFLLFVHALGGEPPSINYMVGAVLVHRTFFSYFLEREVLEWNIICY